ncbi:MAG: hypothetical protein JHD16_09880 [Solirubrobacteraceae bacterium]|nr:hypothetical protein [Solirubrobacteraceae bacterium]
MHRLLRSPTTTRSLLIAGVAIAAITLVPSAGAATTFSRSGNVITLTGDDAADHVSSSGERGFSQVTFYTPDDTTRLIAGPGCRFLTTRDREGHRVLTCGAVARPANPLTLRATLGGGDDRLNLAWNTDRHPRAIVDAGDGNDYVTGTMLADDLTGGPGDDRLDGTQDRDSLKGGLGQDVLSGGGDSDALFGEQGRDNLYGDGIADRNNRTGSYAGLDIVDATDYPTDVTNVTPEAIAALTPERDIVACGQGERDAAVVDEADAVQPTCEAVRGGGRTPFVPDVTPVFPATMTVVPREQYRLESSLRGEPIRFVVTPSAGGFVSAKLELSRTDERRFNVPGGRIIGAMVSTAVTPQTPAEMFVRITWKARQALGAQRQVRAKLTVSATHGDATGTSMQTTTRTTNIVLR